MIFTNRTTAPPSPILGNRCKQGLHPINETQLLPAVQQRRSEGIVEPALGSRVYQRRVHRDDSRTRRSSCATPRKSRDKLVRLTVIVRHGVVVRQRESRSASLHCESAEQRWTSEAGCSWSGYTGPPTIRTVRACCVERR